MALKPVSRRHDDALSRVGWEQFEALVAGHYRSQGYQIEHVGTGETGRCSDGGVDLKLRRDDSYILVQCKRWTAMKVPHNAVHELLGIMVNQGATGAILITSGEFTKAAIEAASRQRNFKLIDGHELRVMLGPAPDSAVDSLARMRGPVAEAAGKAALRLGRAVVAKLIVVGLFLIVLVLVARHLQVVMRSLPAPAVPAATRQETSGASGAAVPSGQVVDGQAQGKRSADELVESQSRTDEGIQVIAETTPEM